jgi:glucarate dehydratase
MKIVEIRATPVTVPMEAPLRWSMGIETGTTRTIIELITDEGIIGVGETYGGERSVSEIRFAEQFIRGLDPTQVGLITSKLQSFRISYESSIAMHVIGGLEMACWDVMGKLYNRPVAALLGGPTRTHVEFSAYLFWRYKGEKGIGGEDTPEAAVERTAQLIAQHGFKVIKFKGGVLSPDIELRTVKLLREAFPDSPIRYDPNAAWSVETSLRYLPRMAEYDLQYAEDLTWNIEGMSTLRKEVPVPLATNMCVISMDQIPIAFRLRPVDIILCDIHFWGGFSNNAKLAAVCEALQLGLGMHSDRELGISTAAMIHFAAATPSLAYAPDSHYHDQVDDIITAPFRYKNGGFDLPEGPGLGVTIDREKLEKYHRLYQQQGDTIEFLDPFRPNWVPNLPIF